MFNTLTIVKKNVQYFSLNIVKSLLQYTYSILQKINEMHERESSQHKEVLGGIKVPSSSERHAGSMTVFPPEWSRPMNS